MNKVPTAFARILLGAIFLVFGLNGFFDFMAMPPMPDKANAFLAGLGASGYFFPFLKSMEVTCGVLLLMDIYVPLALVILAPIVANILMFHAFLAPKAIYLPLGIAVLLIYLSFFSHPYSNIVKKIFLIPMKEKPNSKKIGGLQHS